MLRVLRVAPCCHRLTQRLTQAAAQNGWIDERRAAIESLIAIKRAGADMIISYYAKEALRWLAQE